MELIMSIDKINDFYVENSFIALIFAIQIK